MRPWESVWQFTNREYRQSLSNLDQPKVILMSEQPKNASSIESLEPMVLMSASQIDATSGNDVLFAAEAGQVLDGLDGDDVLLATGGDNAVFGGNGDDTIILFDGHNVVDGGDGDDIVVYEHGSRSDFAARSYGDDGVMLTDCGRRDVLTGVEVVRFNDGTYTIDELRGDGIPIDPDPEYRSIDGTGNNLAHTELGSTDEALLRLATVEYGDGISTPAGDDRPSAREVSNAVSDQVVTQPNSAGLSDAAWLWGQFLDHDISITENADPAEPYSIPVPVGDADFDPFGTGTVEIGLNRSIYEDAETPREQINQITAWIDGSMVYGSDQERSDALREFEGGRLLLTDNDLLIFNEAGLPNAGITGTDAEQARLFLAGDVRANENSALASMHTLWAREHNRIADQLAWENPELTDEQLFQQAREIVIAEIQVITYSEFLPALLGDGALSEYTGYDSSVDPTIANEFSTAAYRFGHSMLSDTLLRLNNDGTPIDAGHLELKDAFFNAQHILDEGIDSLLKGVTSQAANEIDTQVIDGVRNFLFGPPGAGGFDLASLNIQRGRDHGLADYNQTRIDLGLGAVSDFADITSDTGLQDQLRDLYGSVDDIDLWVGGLAEDHVAGSNLGETFHTILVDQFSRLRDGDRFWYTNVLNSDEIQEVESTTLADVIERNTDLYGLQENVFFIA